MQLYFFVAGHPVKAWQLETDWIKEEHKAILRQIHSTLEEKVGSLMCPTHGDEVTAIVSAPSYQQLGVQIRGCCDEFVTVASDRVKPSDIN